MGPNNPISRARALGHLSAKEPPAWQARSKAPPKRLRDVWGLNIVPRVPKKPSRLPDTVWDDKNGEITLPPQSRKPRPRWRRRLLALGVAAVLGGVIGQYVYDRGIAGVIEYASEFVQVNRQALQFVSRRISDKMQ